MRARMSIERPDDLVASVTLSASLKEWDELRSQLENKWPSSELSRAITDVLSKGRKIFYATEAE